MTPDSKKESLWWWDDPLAPFETFDLDASFGEERGSVFRAADGSPAWEVDEDGHVWPDVARLASVARKASRNIVSHIEVKSGTARLAEIVKFGLSQIEEMREITLQEMRSIPGRFRFRVEGSDNFLSDEEAIKRMEDDDASTVLLTWADLNKQAHVARDVDESTTLLAVCAYSACLREIDYALRSLKWGSSEATHHTVAAMDCLKIASEISDLELARERVLSDWGRKARLKGLQNDPKQADKHFVKECWTAWRQAPTRYSSKAAFARDMQDKRPQLTSTKVIEDWCRHWEKLEANP